VSKGHIERVPVESAYTLHEYARSAHLSGPVHDLRQEAQTAAPVLKGRRVIMLNSTARGGGVAEMMPRLVCMLTELGVPTEWWTMGADEPAFFEFTKKIHNMIHGSGSPEISAEARDTYDRVSRSVANVLRRELSPDDILVVHDPQPAGAGAELAAAGQAAVWRCHIGLDEDNEQTDAAWGFLEPYITGYQHCVFTAVEYVPRYLSSTISIIPPGIDPFSHKNRDLSVQEITGILCNGGLASSPPLTVTPAFEHQAKRLQPDGTWGPPTSPEEMDLIHRPVVTQVSRWDRLKGWSGLLNGFVRLKRELAERTRNDARHHRRLQLLRLVLAGPEPEAVQDDPEAQEVLQELTEAYVALEPELQKDVAFISLPMASRKYNALLVNALQRCSSVVVQNSLREGFGLTATEAMWKRLRVVGTQACGLRQQIRDGIDGRLVDNPEDPANVAEVLDQVLRMSRERTPMVTCAQRRVYDEFLVFRQVSRWLRVLTRVVGGPGHPSSVREPEASTAARRSTR
jgi:trehalose synthase